MASISSYLLLTSRLIRFFQMERPEPTVRQVVAYLTFDDVLRDVLKISSPWAVISPKPDSLNIALVRGNLHVVITRDQILHIEVFGFRHPALVGSTEKRPLLRFLKGQETRNVCPGVEDEKLQKYAALPKPGNTYYRHVTYFPPVDQMSTIRSVSCRLFLDPNADALCRLCEQVKPLSLRKLRREPY